MTKLLRLRHWQLFGLLTGLPMIFQCIVMGAIITNHSPAMFFIAFPIMMIFYIALFFGWFYSIGTNLHKKLPATAPMNLARFKLFLIIPVVYMLLISAYMLSLLSNDSSGRALNPAIFAFIIPLHLFSMFCIFYCLYFNAKALKTVEGQKPATFNDFAGEFFLMWFFPIGIWFIQPRLNKLFAPEIGTDRDPVASWPA